MKVLGRPFIWQIRGCSEWHGLSAVLILKRFSQTVSTYVGKDEQDSRSLPTLSQFSSTIVGFERLWAAPECCCLPHKGFDRQEWRGNLAMTQLIWSLLLTLVPTTGTLCCAAHTEERRDLEGAGRCNGAITFTVRPLSEMCVFFVK